MKPSTSEIQIADSKTADEPVISFAHLSSCFASEAILNDNQVTPYGFPAALEEDLHETGYLAKIFLRC